jgi:hypothetical protein
VLLSAIEKAMHPSKPAQSVPLHRGRETA